MGSLRAAPRWLAPSTWGVCCPYHRPPPLLGLSPADAKYASFKDIASGDGRYGLLGLLHVIRMTDPDLTMLALGTDLTSLGGCVPCVW